MIEQIVGAVIAVLVAVAACFAYFWGTNWILDRLLSSNAMAGDNVTRRDNLRSSIRPWLFIFPAMLFLSLYLPAARDAPPGLSAAPTG